MPISRIRTGTIVHVLDDHVADLVRRVDLGIDQAQEELVIAGEKPGESIKFVLIRGVQNVLQRDLGAEHLGAGQG